MPIITGDKAPAAKTPAAKTPAALQDEQLYNSSLPEYDPKHMPAVPTTAAAATKAQHTSVSVPVASADKWLAPSLDESRVALIIETRPAVVLPALLTHMIAALPPQWVVKMVGTNESFASVRKSRSLQHHINSTKLLLQELPDVYPMTSQETVSQTLTNITFYRDFLAPAEWILMFQTDSIICSASEQSIDDWVAKNYSWVGAPWNYDVPGGNGGLSLRHVPRIVSVLEREQRPEGHRQWEDTWLTEKLKDSAAPAKEEVYFSVESLYTEMPLGYHLRGSGKLADPGIWSNATRRRQIFEYCPETKILLGNMRREAGNDKELLEEEKRIDGNVWRKAQGLPLIPKPSVGNDEKELKGDKAKTEEKPKESAVPSATKASTPEESKKSDAATEASRLSQAAEGSLSGPGPQELAKEAEASALEEATAATKAKGGEGGNGGAAATGEPKPYEAATSKLVGVEGSMTAMAKGEVKPTEVAPPPGVGEAGEAEGFPGDAVPGVGK